jgi:pimeloyl-ACP methyl ester carboxylesterase
MNRYPGADYAESVERFGRDGLHFDVRDSGPDAGPVVVLLHGFPQFNNAWDAIVPHLTAKGYRCLAPNQRGYSPMARPPRRSDYRMPELADDVCALIDASGADRVHLAGHDMGALVAWSFAARYPHRLASLSTLSTPHPAALRRAIFTSRQGLASWYMFFVQIPALPERIFLGRDGNAALLSKTLQAGTQNSEAADRDARAMSEPGAMTGAANWYRALPLSGRVQKVRSPTMYVWSDGDAYVLKPAAELCARYVTGEYRFEILHGVSHWMLEERPDEVAGLLLDWFAAHA